MSLFFDFHISNLAKRTKHLTGWMLKTFSSRDKLAMLTLFKALVMSRLDYGCQLWSPYLIKHINMVEKVQRSFTRFITSLAKVPATCVQDVRVGCIQDVLVFEMLQIIVKPMAGSVPSV